ncbi:MAG: site-specific tyrosine recombinase XerD [Phycisphaerae bacterium]
MAPLVHDKFTPRLRDNDIPKAVKLFLDYLFVECGLAGNTIIAYAADLREFWPDVSDNGRLPADLDIQDVQDHLIKLRERGLSTASIARHLATIKMFLRFHHQSGLLRRDVASVIELPKKWHRLPDTVHADQIIALLDEPEPADEYYHRDRALLELLYASGMRVSELVGVTLDTINLDIGYLRCMGKGNKERIVPIGRPAIQAIKEYLVKVRPALATSQSGRALFLSRTGRPLDRTNVWRLVRKYATRAGITKNLHPHTIRHCFATHMLAGGADLRIVQELLGHADPATTQVYLHVDQVRLKQVHRRYHPRQ